MGLAGFYHTTLSPWSLVPWLSAVLIWHCAPERGSSPWGWRLVGFVLLNMFMKWNCVWNFLFELPAQCEHPPREDNTTGLRVFVAAGAKMGTRTISHALNDIGLRTYLGEDFDLFSYWDFYADELARRGA